MDFQSVHVIKIDEAATLLESSVIIKKLSTGGMLAHHLQTPTGNVVLIQSSDSFLLVK